MNIQKLRDMNLHTVADELERLREFKAKVESQEPVIRISGGRVVDFNPNYGGSVSEGAFYAKPVPADKPARITEQDVREIIDAYWDSPYVCDDWLKSADVRALLNKLNADREQLPAVAVPKYVTVSQVPNSQYAKGWNDCVDYMLEAAPSHSQQSADAVKAFCKDIGLYDPEYDDQEYIEVSRQKLKEHVESLYDRCPSHESEQL